MKALPAQALVECRACPRLLTWREEVAKEKRAAFRDQQYWGRPVPAFGDPDADLVVVGLAPAAHGANRTGRMFTGDRSGDWLYRALYRAGFSNQPQSHDKGDGLLLSGVLITAAVRCAPPDNRPEKEELANCAPWLDLDLRQARPKVVVALGGIALQALLSEATRLGWRLPRPRPRFSHGLESKLGDGPYLLASYHPSQQNTFTGRLTEGMFDLIFSRVRQLLAGEEL
ncbi:MAG: uracil-DNA glycosylase [Acidimicrobiia bacterium]|nr:uracil-DNA glycosylase [Acidimicrobiia bacterium]